MSLAITRRAAGRRRTRSRRLLVILVLVAAGLLLAVPGVAGAHVRAKYRAEYKTTIWNFRFCRSVNAFKGKARRYFATVKQQRRFKHACDLLKSYSGCLLLLANTHVYDSYKFLGVDPPALDLSAQAIADGDEDAATGHEGFDKQLAALRTLL